MKNINKVTLISNAGILWEVKDKKVVIDGFCKARTSFYKDLPEDAGQKLIQGIAPFDNIDVMLITHEHTDHFDPERTSEFLIKNPGAYIISNKEVIKSLLGTNILAENSRLIVSEPDLNCAEDIFQDNISIRSFSMSHQGRRYSDVQNLAFLVDIEGTKIFHVGDAKHSVENFEGLGLERERIDILLAPFPYISITEGRYIVEKYIRPKKIGVIHMPYRDQDSQGWIESAKRSYVKVKDHFPETIFLNELNEAIEL